MRRSRRFQLIDSWFDNYVGVVMLVRVVMEACPVDGESAGLRWIR